MPNFDLFVGGFPCQPYPEKKNIPKNRNGAHSKRKRFIEIRDKILQAIWYNYYAGIAWQNNYDDFVNITLHNYLKKTSFLDYHQYSQSEVNIGGDPVAWPEWSRNRA